jgi:hypothetical protein
MRQHIVRALCVIALTGGILEAQSAADSAAIRAAVSDYVEGFYTGDTLRFNRSIRRDIHKYGFMRSDAGRYTGSLMPWQYFLESAEEVRSGRDKAPPDALRRIELLDVLDQIAVAKLTALWGIDYLTLAKYDGRWMIQQVLWQMHPPRGDHRPVPR